jgi:hypothetical protein
MFEALRGHVQASLSAAAAPLVCTTVGKSFVDGGRATWL